MWEVRAKFHGYLIDGFHFEPPNPKNLVFQSLRVEKDAFLRILITVSPIPIPFLSTTFFRPVRGAS